MKITEETEENSKENHSELYFFPEDDELKVALEEQERDLLEDLSFLPEKMRKILEQIDNSKKPLTED
ncbi:MAG: hypothetical protein ACTSWY_07735 [Promethearchaeota archaeon]